MRSQVNIISGSLTSSDGSDCSSIVVAFRHSASLLLVHFSDFTMMRADAGVLSDLGSSATPLKSPHRHAFSGVTGLYLRFRFCLIAGIDCAISLLKSHDENEDVVEINVSGGGESNRNAIDVTRVAQFPNLLNLINAFSHDTHRQQELDLTI
jgi:hypothetical protein